MQKRQWMPILQRILKGDKVDYIVLNDCTKLYSQYPFKKRIFNGTTFTGKYSIRTSHYWVSATTDCIRMNFPSDSKYYDCAFTGIPINNIKYVQFM